MNKFAVTRTSLYEQIADILEKEILSPESDMVDKLPSEQELAKLFSVSRPVIREALKLLKERGLITSRNGNGSYVAEPKTDTVASAVSRIMHMKNIDNDDLHEVRLILETAAVRKAAQKITDEELAIIGKINDNMKDKDLPIDKRVSLDSDFHAAIAQSGKNELLQMFIEVLNTLTRDYMKKGALLPGGPDDTVARHAAIFSALSNHDPDAAEKAMKEHLSVSRQSVGIFEDLKKSVHLTQKK